MEQWGFLTNCRYLLHDRDGKFCPSFDEISESGNGKPIPLPTWSPNLNAFSERSVKSVKEECLSQLILFGEASLKRALQQYLIHYHEERNHQGKNNKLLFPRQTQPAPQIPVLPAGTFLQKQPTQALRPGSCFIPSTPIALLVCGVYRATTSHQKIRPKSTTTDRCGLCISFLALRGRLESQTRLTFAGRSAAESVTVLIRQTHVKPTRHTSS